MQISAGPCHFKGLRQIVVGAHFGIESANAQSTRSEKGQRWLERIWTVMATCAKTGRSVFTFLQESLTAYWSDQPHPSLLSDTT